MNLLVTGAFAWTQEELNCLRQMGHNVVFMQQEKDALPCEASWVEGIIGNGIFLSHPIEQFTSLKLIQLTSAGFDRVPMEYVTAQSIAIYNARGVYSIPMAEFALGGVLQLHKQSGFFHENQKARKWEKHRGLIELYGKNVCIVGCGSVGNACAQRFHSFGCHVTGIDVMPYENTLYEDMQSLEGLDDALHHADVVVLTLPLTEQTKHLMDSKRFAAMKPGAILVNIARGGVLDTQALLEALRGHLGGAVLDVFESEPLPEDSPLWELDNVLLTPHNSFVSDGNHSRMLAVILNNLKGMKQ